MKKLLLGFLSISFLSAGLSYSNVAKAEEKEIKVGVILPLTGKLSVVGEGEKKGIIMGLSDLKKRFPNIKIELIIEDFASETKNAVTIANKLISIDKVDAIITSTTAASEAVSPIINNTPKIHFVISPDIEILKKSKYNYRIYYNFRSEGKIVNKFIDNNKPKKISFISVLYSSFQKEIEEIIEPYAKKNFINISSKDFLKIENRDFRTAILKSKTSNPELIFLSPQVNQVEPLTDQLIENNFLPNNNRKFLTSFSFILKPKYFNKLENFYIISPKFQINNKTKEALNFQKVFKSNANFDIMYAYDNINILGELLIKSQKNINSFEKLFNNIKNYNGASGKIKFIGNRDTDVDIVLTQIKNGKQEEVKLK